MKPLTRRITFAAFVAVGTFAIAAASSLSAPWNILLDVALAVAAYFSGQLLFWPPASPVVLTPVLEVPPSFQSVSADQALGAGVETHGDVEIAQAVPEAFAVDESAVIADLDNEISQPLPQVVAAGPQVNEEPLAELLALVDDVLLHLNLPSPLAAQLVEIQGGTDFVRENVQRGYEISDNLAGSAQQAFELAEKVQRGVTIVINALTESLKQTKVLYEHSQRIAKILALMSEVSDKIHILSINASIVSARAGVMGRGFEVVAKEIRSLAKETETSLGEIEEVIGLLQSTISTVIRVVNDADKETEEEKNSLISVAGSLQGVILGVEIIRAVSSFAKEKSEENSMAIKKVIETGALDSEIALKDRLSTWSQRLQQYLPKE
jgi:hypothetical protein